MGINKFMNIPNHTYEMSEESIMKLSDDKCHHHDFLTLNIHQYILANMWFPIHCIYSSLNCTWIDLNHKIDE